MDSDLILIFKMRQGNDAAWEQFVRKYYADILKYCYFHCRNRELAEDLTQEVFLKFFAALAQYRHLGKTKNYLYTIARNQCNSQSATRSDLPLDEVLNAVNDHASAIDDRLMLDTAIRRLPPDLKDVILLRYYQDLKLSEIAAVSKIGLPLVKYRLKRAKELLRKEIDHEFE